MSAKHEGDFAHSLTDLMAGVAVTFLLIAAIFMVQAAKAKRLAVAAQEAAKHEAKTNQADAEELARLRDAEKTSIQGLRELAAELSNDPELSSSVASEYDPSVDPRLLTITFRDQSLHFGPGACRVEGTQLADLQDLLKRLFPKICKLTEDVRASGRQRRIDIGLEGHTDSDPVMSSNCVRSVSAQCIGKWREPACKRSAFETNVKLSSERAHYVFFQARAVFADERMTEIARCLDTYFVAAGRGPVEPADRKGIYEARSDQEKERNRRVVIKVRVGAAAASQAKP